jgi:hypothetical protein
MIHHPKPPTEETRRKWRRQKIKEQIEDEIYEKELRARR